MADKTYANLMVETSLANADLVAFYPAGGPLKVIAYQNLVAEVGDDLASRFLTVLNNLSDLNSAGVARTNLGLGTAAVKNLGTANDTVALLGANGKTPISTLPGGYLTKTADYVVTLADAGKTIDCTGTIAITLPAASTVGETFWVEIRNSGTGVVTIAPASGQIDGASSVTQTANTTRNYVNNATNYFSTTQTFQGWTLIDSKSLSGVSSVVFANVPQTYSELVVEISGASFTLSRLLIAASSDGVAFSGSASPTEIGTATYYGQIHIRKYASQISAMSMFVGKDNTAPAILPPDGNNLPNGMVTIKTPSGVKHLRFSSQSGNFGGGTLTMYGR